MGVDEQRCEPPSPLPLQGASFAGKGAIFAGPPHDPLRDHLGRLSSWLFTVRPVLIKVAEILATIHVDMIHCLDQEGQLWLLMIGRPGTGQNLCELWPHAS